MLIVFGGFLGCSQQNPSTEKANNDYLQKLALEKLNTILNHQEEWVKVHAAEYLVDLGYTEEVINTFYKEQVIHGTQYPYRIGIWRVLARVEADKWKKQMWIDSIHAAYMDTLGADRVHAVESLAKLTIQPDIKTANKVMEEDNLRLKAYTTWAMAIPEKENRKPDISQLLELLESDDRTSQRIAAYAIRKMKVVLKDLWTGLYEKAMNEPENSSLRVYLMAAAYTSAAEDVKFSEAYKSLETSLLKLYTSQSKADRYHLCEVLAEYGNASHLPILENLMDGKDPIIEGIDKDFLKTSSARNHPWNVDVSAAAAYAICKIELRTSG